MQRFFIHTVLAIGVSVSIASAATAQTRAEALIQAFADIPQSYMRLEGSFGQHISFHDPSAVREFGLAANIERFDPSLAALAITGPAPLTQTLMLSTEEGWLETVGFAPKDINSIVAIEAPPVTAYSFALAPGTAQATTEILLNTGYVMSDAEGAAHYRRGEEDFQPDLGNRNPADPFGGQLGLASRVMVDEDRLGYSTSTPVLIDLMADARPSLMDHPDIAALTSALNGPELGQQAVLQATLLSDPLIFSGLAVSRDLRPIEPQSPPVGPWTMGLFAETADQSTISGVIALAFVSESAAQQAANNLPDVFETYESLVSGGPISEVLFGTPQIAVSESEPRVLLIVISTALDADLIQTRARPFHRIQQLFLNRDLSFLRPM